MNEGWQDEDYLILLNQDEIATAMTAYDFDRFMPGYLLIGLKGWDEFIVIDSAGSSYTVPTVPLDVLAATSFMLPQQISLQPDSRFTDKIKWYLKPLVFGGDPADDTNIVWVAHAQHAELVCWWNEQYKKAKTQQSGS